MRPDQYYRAKQRLREDLLRFGDDQQDAREVEPPVLRFWLGDDCFVDVGKNDVVHTGDDLGGTGFFPLWKAPLCSKRAALSLFYKILSFLRVR